MNFDYLKMEKKTNLDWELGYSFEKNVVPTNYIIAKVPGAVQLDIAHAENYPDYNYADNYKMFGWMEDLFYTYRTNFDMPHLHEDDRLWFVSKGIDYQFEIKINEKKIYSQEGMFTYVELDLTDYLLESNCLEILVMPAPKREGYPEDRTQASNVVKPAVSYGWDWHPRLIPLGIWDKTYFEERNANQITDTQLEYALSDDFTCVEIKLKVEVTLKSMCHFLWQLKDDQGNIVINSSCEIFKSFSKTYVLANPHLWWSHDHGIPYLYTSTFKLIENNITLQKIERKIGFRKIRLIMNEGSWNEPKEFPKTQSVLPAQLELNGRPIFVKGTNWVNPEIFPGKITEKRYKELLDIAVDTNFNLIRAWGGSIVNKESFYEICDKLGIMVWQDFPLACNNYPDDSNYISILDQEATSIIKRLNKHPCVVLWCGGNELFNNWSGMSNQSLALRLLDSLCFKFDKNTPFIPTSPLYGMAHGNYIFKWENEDVFQMINRSRNTAYNEFGVPGISPLDVLAKIIPPDDLFPPKNDTAWESHHAFGSWEADKSTWLCHHILTEYLGEAQSLEELIVQSQLLQSEGYKAIYEEARRQKPYCSMALNWCFNEPWPSAANNSLIVYPAIPKPALFAVKNSCRPICVSARISKFVWTEGENFYADIWMLNDTFCTLPGGNILVKLLTENVEIKILEWNYSNVDSNKNLAGPSARFELPKWDTDRFKLILEVVSSPAFNSEYTLVYRSKKELVNRTFSMNIT